MYCLRCGRETIDEQAFCLECQKEMAKYPVDPGTVVQLPIGKPTPPKKTPKRRITPEEQVRFLRKRVRMYASLFIAALVLLVCLAVPLIMVYRKNAVQIGQNYSTVTDKNATSPSAAGGQPG